MPDGTVIPAIPFCAYDNEGAPLSGGKLTALAAGTASTKVDTYADRELTIPNTNPVILDAGGRATIFLSAIAYRFVLTDADDVPVWDIDGVLANQGVGGSSGLDVPITAGQDLAINDQCYISDGSGGLVAGRAYKADATLAYASIDATLGFATTEILSGDSGFQRRAGSLDGFTALVAGSTYYVATVAGTITATPPTHARSVGVAISATTIIIDISPRRPSLINALVCQGRLTLTTAVPVTTADVTAATTLRFTPYKGNRVDLFDGTRWNRRTFTELSIAVPATTATGYDVFLVDTNGTLSLELLAWTNLTTRATALVSQDGALVKTGALTRLYLGSFRTTAVSGQTEDSKAKRYVWNYHHRVPRSLELIEATASWTYTIATFRQARATVTNQVEVFIGVAEVPVDLSLIAHASNDTGGLVASVSIGLDSTSVPASNIVQADVTLTTAGSRYLMVVRYVGVPAVGQHAYVWLEASGAVGVTTWTGTGGGLNGHSGLLGSVMG